MAFVSIYSELKRRNVFRVGAAYLAGSWLIIQLINEISPLLGVSETIGRVALIMLAIGLIPALLIAWLFELTPEGFRRESSTLHGSAESVRATRRMDRTIIIILALAVVVFSVDRFVLVPARDARLVADAVEQARTAERIGSSRDGPSIAVLAFDDLSPGGDLEYFSDGISIELMDRLGKIPNLRVIARESAFWFKGKDATYAEIGAKLGVGRLLEGAVRVAGDQVRVTASLIDPSTEEQVWSYSPGVRPMSDVFAIQTEIATEVVDKLQLALTGALPALDQTTPEIHSLYLQARDILERGEFRRLGYARDLLEQAVERDPNFFPARYWLVSAYFYLSITPGFDRAENLRLWASAIEQAALRWPDRPEIMSFRALQAFQNQDFATAAQYLESSLRQDHSSSAPWAMAQNLLNVLNRPEEAVEVGEHVLMRNPICGPCYSVLIRNYVLLRRFEDAVALHAQAENLGLELPWWDPAYSVALLYSDPEAALAEFRRDEVPSTIRLAGSAMALYALGRIAESEQALAELNEVVETQPEFTILLARVYSFVGDIDRAFEILNRLPQLRASIFSDPEFGSLRKHPRYEELLEKASIWPEDWRESIHFEYSLPE